MIWLAAMCLLPVRDAERELRRTVSRQAVGIQHGRRARRIVRLPRGSPETGGTVR